MYETVMLEGETVMSSFLDSWSTEATIWSQTPSTLAATAIELWVLYQSNSSTINEDAIVEIKGGMTPNLLCKNILRDGAEKLSML